MMLLSNIGFWVDKNHSALFFDIIDEDNMESVYDPSSTIISTTGAYFIYRTTAVLTTIGNYFS